MRHIEGIPWLSVIPLYRARQCRLMNHGQLALVIDLTGVQSIALMLVYSLRWSVKVMQRTKSCGS